MNTTELLFEAVVNNDLEEVKRFIQAKVSLDIEDERRTPLHYAAWNGNLPIVECLVKAGASLNVKGIKGWTPLHHAATNRNSSAVVEYLVQAGAFLDAKDDGGWTPLHLAVQYGHLSVVECLLKLGADYLAVSDIGKTAKEVAQDKKIRDLLQQWEDEPDVKEPDCY